MRSCGLTTNVQANRYPRALRSKSSQQATPSRQSLNKTPLFVGLAEMRIETISRAKFDRQSYSECILFLNSLRAASLKDPQSPDALRDCIAYRLTADTKESRCLGWANPFTLRTDSLDLPEGPQGGDFHRPFLQWRVCFAGSELDREARGVVSEARGIRILWLRVFPGVQSSWDLLIDHTSLCLTRKELNRSRPSASASIAKRPQSRTKVLSVLLISRHNVSRTRCPDE